MTDQRFHEAVELYGDMVFRLAYSYLKNRADAEDVMQESLLKLYVEPREFESPDHEKHWLLRVAANECKKLLRSPWRRRTDPLDEAEEAAVFDRPAQSELFRQVMALPPKYRAVVHLYYWEGLDQGEIGDILHISRTAVQTRMQRARAMLKKELSDDEELPEHNGAGCAE